MALTEGRGRSIATWDKGGITHLQVLLAQEEAQGSCWANGKTYTCQEEDLQHKDLLVMACALSAGHHCMSMACLYIGAWSKHEHYVFGRQSVLASPLPDADTTGSDPYGRPMTQPEQGLQATFK